MNKMGMLGVVCLLVLGCTEPVRLVEDPPPVQEPPAELSPGGSCQEGHAVFWDLPAAPLAAAGLAFDLAGPVRGLRVSQAVVSGPFQALESDVVVDGPTAVVTFEGEGAVPYGATLEVVLKDGDDAVVPTTACTLTLGEATIAAK